MATSQSTRSSNTPQPGKRGNAGRHGKHFTGIRPSTPMVSLTCETCGGVFEKKASELRVRKRIRFCSWDCLKGAPQAEYVEQPCKQCGKTVRTLRAHLKYGKGEFCSRGCFAASRKVEGAKWRDAEQIKKYMADYVARHRSRLNQLQYERDRLNPEPARARRKRWSKKNKPRLSVLANVRRARKSGNGGSYTLEEWDALKREHGYKCLACGKQEPEIQLTADHVIPIIMGGSSFITNIQPLCGPCNSKKSRKMIDYRQPQQRLLER